MKKLFRGLLLVGTLAGAAVILRSYIQRSGAASDEEAVQLVFEDGSTRSLPSNSVEGQEFTDIARKVVEIGV